MKYSWIYIIVFVCSVFAGHADNIRVDSLTYNPMSVGGGSGNTLLKMKFLVVWENSWRDDYNYDAAYVFFKFKKLEKQNNQAEPWHHLFLTKEGNQITGEDKGEYDFWLSPLSGEGTNLNTGVYIYRKNKGTFKKDSVWMEVTWDVVQQMISPQLTTEDVHSGLLQVVPHALEMVYIPRGAYRIGDGISEKGFGKLITPIPMKYDLVSNAYELNASSGDPRLAADRVNDNKKQLASEWKPATGAGSWWMIDFGQGKTKRVTYFGVNGSSFYPDNYPTQFCLLATKDPASPETTWDTLWIGAGKDNWAMAHDAYPAEKALKIEKPGLYRAYKVVVLGMNSGTPVVTSIGMTEANLDEIIDHTALIDSPVTEIDTLRRFGASDGNIWATGEIPATFPNGYCGFYAMKYELSQDQYVRFLNKLSFQQQDGLLDGRLATMQEGEYIFGDPDKANHRNGIILARKIGGMPAVFACDLNKNTLPEQANDGQNIACNYMNIRDMLAYADWACLRPLTEMEYEKMCRQFYPELPVRGSYAWGTTDLETPGELSGKDTELEHAVSGNANWGGVYDGPCRVGAFVQTQNPTLEHSGAGFWGVMDLTGNLAEMYYNVNNRGLTLILPETGNGLLPAGHSTAHGDGSLDVNGNYNGVKTKQWSEEPGAVGLRGGSYTTGASHLSVSDRTQAMGYFKTLFDRDSTVTFRLGRTAPVCPEITSWLINENEETTQDGSKGDIPWETTYRIMGNRPADPQGGVCHYIWYCAEGGGDWQVMEGETNPDLYFDKYANSTTVNNIRELGIMFKRKVFTPFTDSETTSENLIILQSIIPFDQSVTYFNASGSYKVARSWDDLIPQKWSLEKSYPGLTINEKTGVISGFRSDVMYDIWVCLEMPGRPGTKYKKHLKQNAKTLSCTKNYQAMTLLAGTYRIECYGARGGVAYQDWSVTAYGGLGGYAKGEIHFDQDITLYAYVGGFGGNGGLTYGWNGGGYGGANGDGEPGGGGGGASDVRLIAGNLYSRIIVAGGGGGAGNYSGGPAGGGLSGGNGGVAGGTQTSGNSFGTGGNGGNDSNYNSAGGGGGGGYWGGWGAGTNAGSGGAGSGFVSGMPGCNAVTANGSTAGSGQPNHYSGYVFRNCTMINGKRDGDGAIVFTLIDDF